MYPFLKIKPFPTIIFLDFGGELRCSPDLSVVVSGILKLRCRKQEILGCAGLYNHANGLGQWGLGAAVISEVRKLCGQILLRFNSGIKI